MTTQERYEHICKALNVPFNRIFRVKEKKNTWKETSDKLYKFTADGLYHSIRGRWVRETEDTIVNLLIGLLDCSANVDIMVGDTFYFVDIDGEVAQMIIVDDTTCLTLSHTLLQIGNYYATAADAERDRDFWKKFYNDKLAIVFDTKKKITDTNKLTPKSIEANVKLSTISNANIQLNNIEAF